MPIYEYRCVDCCNVDEFIQHLDAPSTAECSNCGGPSKRILSKCSFDIPGFKNGQPITENDFMDKSNG